PANESRGPLLAKSTPDAPSSQGVFRGSLPGGRVPNIDPEPEQGTPLLFRRPSPWPEPVDDAELLADLIRLITTFAALPPGTDIAVALWIMFAHAIDHFAVAPLLALVSPTKRCGKTTLLGILSRLVPRAIPTSNITPAALFRAVQKFK